MDLRQYLRDTDPELGASLDHSWRIAEREWTALLPVDGESQAGLPHLKSVEEWLNNLAEQCRPRWSKRGNAPFGLNTAEIYILLASVLFHDIGRPAAVRTGKKHGEESRKLIESHWERLGIRDARMAHEIGLIAEFHTQKGKWPHTAVARILPWGPVNTESLAALLTLVDELDNAFTRATPSYMQNPSFRWDNKDESSEISYQELYDAAEKDENLLTNKGPFRRYINSVEFDITSHLIKTSIRNDSLPGGKAYEKNQLLMDWQKDCREYPIHYVPQPDKDGKIIEDKHVDERLNDLFFHYLQFFERDKPNHELPNYLARLYFSCIEYDQHKSFKNLECLENRNPLISDIYENAIFWNRSPHLARPWEISQTLYTIQNFDKITQFVSEQLLPTLKEFHKHLEKMQNDGKLTNVLSNLSCIIVTVWENVAKDLLCIEEQNDKKYQRESNALYEKIKAIFKINFMKDTIKNFGDKKIIEKEEEKINLPNELFDKNKKGTLPAWYWIEFWNMELNKTKDKIVFKTDSVYKIIISFFYSLTFINLKKVFECDYNDVSTFYARAKNYHKNPESWSLPHYVENLFFAMHICIRLMREMMGFSCADSMRCDRGDNDESIYYRANNFITKLYTEQPTINYFTPSDANTCASNDVKLDGKDGRKNVKDEAEDYLKKRTKAFKAVSDLWKDHLIPKDQVKVLEVEQAIQFTFMNWIANDTKGKQKKLDNLKEALRRIDVPFEKWVIEYNNHLFDKDWRMVIEPTLRPEDLLDTYTHLKDLWEKAKGRQGQIPFDSLKALLHETSQDKINVRTNRLHNLLYLFNNKNDENKSDHYFFEDLMRMQLQRRKDAKDGEGGYITLHSGPDYFSFASEASLPDKNEMKSFLERFNDEEKQEEGTK